MTFAPDGSPIEVYARLPERGEAELIAAAVRPPARLLELGCGTGRVTRPLLARGYAVTAVDESNAMLRRAPAEAEIVHAAIEGLDLGRTFDAVVLASNLLTTTVDRRRAFLATCARHADVAIVEILPIAWQPRDGVTQLGDVRSNLHIESFDEGLVVGAVDYEVEGRRWTHAFEMRVFRDEIELRSALAEGGFTFERWLERERGWFVARSERARA